MKGSSSGSIFWSIVSSVYQTKNVNLLYFKRFQVEDTTIDNLIFFFLSVWESEQSNFNLFFLFSLSFFIRGRGGGKKMTSHFSYHKIVFWKCICSHVSHFFFLSLSLTFSLSFTFCISLPLSLKFFFSSISNLDLWTTWSCEANNCHLDEKCIMSVGREESEAWGRWRQESKERKDERRWRE